MGLNVFGVGRLVADPEQPTGGPAKFRLAIDDYNRATKTREASFWDCVAWGKTGETIMKYTEKGKQVSIVGTLSRRKYTSRTGEEREAVEINVQSVELLGSKGTTSSDPTIGTPATW